MRDPNRKLYGEFRTRDYADYTIKFSAPYEAYVRVEGFYFSADELANFADHLRDVASDLLTKEENDQN